MVRLSIIVPVYNVEDYLDQCINSILGQTFCDFELLLIDDGSTDKSGEICDKWAALDRRIIVIHQKNGGQLSARSSGVAKANGEFIAFIDSDDYIGKDLFSDLFKQIDIYKPDVLAYGYKRVTEGGKYIDTILNNCNPGFYVDNNLDFVFDNLVSDVHIKEYNMGSIIYGVASKIFYKDFYLKHVPNISNAIVNGEDMVVTMSCIVHCSRLYISEVSDYNYRQRDNSMLHTFRLGDLRNYSKLCEFLINDINRIPLENIQKFMCEVASHNVYLAASELSSYGTFKVYFKNNVDEFVLKLLRFAKISNLGLKNWFRVLTIRKQFWIVFFLYRKLKNRK